MSDYKERLVKYGLQMNNNGELEDIPTSETQNGGVLSKLFKR